LHVRDINQFDLGCWKRRSYMATLRVEGRGQGHCSSTLGLSIAFLDLAAEGNLEEIKHFLGDRGRSGDHCADAATKNISELVKDESIIECVCSFASGTQLGELLLNTPLSKSLLEPLELLDLRLHQIVESVV
jgi:hypothetical protein